MRSNGSNLERLKQLAEALPPTLTGLPGLVGRQQGCLTEYKVETGTCIGTGLLNKADGSVAVQDAFLSKGTRFPVHSHGTAEVIIVYKGKIRTQGMDDGEQIIGPAEHVAYGPQEMHLHEALEDSWVVAVSIPAAKGYPNA